MRSCWNPRGYFGSSVVVGQIYRFRQVCSTAAETLFILKSPRQSVYYFHLIEVFKPPAVNCQLAVVKTLRLRDVPIIIYDVTGVINTSSISVSANLVAGYIFSTDEFVKRLIDNAASTRGSEISHVQVTPTYHVLPLGRFACKHRYQWPEIHAVRSLII